MAVGPAHHEITSYDITVGFTRRLVDRGTTAEAGKIGPVLRGGAFGGPVDGGNWTGRTAGDHPDS